MTNLTAKKKTSVKAKKIIAIATKTIQDDFVTQTEITREKKKLSTPKKPTLDKAGKIKLTKKEFNDLMISLDKENQVLMVARKNKLESSIKIGKILNTVKMFNGQFEKASDFYAYILEKFDIAISTQKLMIMLHINESKITMCKSVTEARNRITKLNKGEDPDMVDGEESESIDSPKLKTPEEIAENMLNTIFGTIKKQEDKDLMFKIFNDKYETEKKKRLKALKTA